MQKCKVYRRNHTGESQRVIAKRLGVSQATISAYERNFETRKSSILKRLKVLLEVCPVNEYRNLIAEIKSLV